MFVLGRRGSRSFNFTAISVCCRLTIPQDHEMEGIYLFRQTKIPAPTLKIDQGLIYTKSLHSNEASTHSKLRPTIINRTYTRITVHQLRINQIKTLPTLPLQPLATSPKPDHARHQHASRQHMHRNHPPHPSTTTHDPPRPRPPLHPRPVMEVPRQTPTVAVSPQVLSRLRRVVGPVRRPLVGTRVLGSFLLLSISVVFAATGELLQGDGGSVVEWILWVVDGWCLRNRRWY